MSCTVGVDIGGTKTAIGVFDENKRLLDKNVFATDASLSAKEFAAVLCDEMRALCPRPSGIGVCAPSRVDAKKGRIIHTTNLPALCELDICDILTAEFGCIARAENDANAAALGEFTCGAGRGAQSMVFCAISTGIGGGIITDGRIWRGCRDYAAEIGHMLITPGEGVMCGCKNKGCFESYCAGANIYKHVALRIERGETTVMTRGTDIKDIDGRVLLAAYDAGDAMARELVSQMGYYLGVMMYNLYQVLNIDTYVLGGGLYEAFGSRITQRMQETFRSFCKEDVRFLPAELGGDMGIVGANELIYA